jgi:hypothetical protein
MACERCCFCCSYRWTKLHVAELVWKSREVKHENICQIHQEHDQPAQSTRPTWRCLKCGNDDAASPRQRAVISDRLMSSTVAQPVVKSLRRCKLTKTKPPNFLIQTLFLHQRRLACSAFSPREMPIAMPRNPAFLGSSQRFLDFGIFRGKGPVLHCQTCLAFHRSSPSGLHF